MNEIMISDSITLGKPVTYERFDSCHGVVTGRCKTGAFLTLDNGETAFANKFASLYPGTRVLCSIQRLAEVDRFAGVSLDSVLSYAPRIPA